MLLRRFRWLCLKGYPCRRSCRQSEKTDSCSTILSEHLYSLSHFWTLIIRCLRLGVQEASLNHDKALNVFHVRLPLCRYDYAHHRDIALILPYHLYAAMQPGLRMVVEVIHNRGQQLSLRSHLRSLQDAIPL